MARHRKSGKTQFPKSWSDDRILHNIQDVKDNPTSTGVGAHGATYYRGQRDGVNIEVYDYSPGHTHAGKISTGYPVQ
ncbi:EndoU domain-containing protein [Loktanella agnita]|uniref:EndoU domain-containing protein n=1 Tax=Loktanella agnita TaxID=287097 RepID=UPI003985E056